MGYKGRKPRAPIVVKGPCWVLFEVMETPSRCTARLRGMQGAGKIPKDICDEIIAGYKHLPAREETRIQSISWNGGTIPVRSTLLGWMSAEGYLPAPKAPIVDSRLMMVCHRLRDTYT